jgi:valyl-tRNA synthetase
MKNENAPEALPERYVASESETKHARFWEENSLYHYDEKRPRAETYIVDTPPPTVSGQLHMGHVFSYSQTDILVRYQRMCGKNIFYPMGWDDNGLPTERRVQMLNNVRCVPSKVYDPSFVPDLKSKAALEISRQNFLELCAGVTAEDEKKYEALFRHLGLSIDWRQQYETINRHSRTISQYSFLDLYKKGEVYSIQAPTMWDTDFQTAVAQADVEDREGNGNYHDLIFKTEKGESFTISTTRPELLGACIAVVAHPDDTRYQHLFGQMAVTPLFAVAVPIMPAMHADPEKGTGILMVCTFGDVHDVQFWKASKLPLRQIMGRGGQLIPIIYGEGDFPSTNAEQANRYYQQLTGLFANTARKKIVELFKESEAATGEVILKGDLRPTVQFVKYYEKGQRPLEYISTRQWFIKVLDHKEELVALGDKVAWHPPHMQNRYQQWVENLNQDWCISRQRFFGVPFPVWYPLDADGEPLYDQPIVAAAETLPIDPLVDCPPGFKPEQRGQAKGFMGDPDVMDTWATSSCTPQLSSHWGIKGTEASARHEKLFPATLRPQAHEIIRTWAFYTMTKSWLHHRSIPWENIAISGWVVDPDKKKMSKSKGNTVTPEGLITTYSADALRYWAGRARLGQDTIFDESIFKLGQRLTTKLFNAAKFVMGLCSVHPTFSSFQPQQQQAAIYEGLDLAWINRLNSAIEQSTQMFDRLDYGGALAQAESAFWEFCDHYVEFVKIRSYQNTPGGVSAAATLDWSLQVFLKLLAPFLPYITEEIWSWQYGKLAGQAKSVHRATWPKVMTVASSNAATAPNAEVFALAKEVVSFVRGEKTTQRKSLMWPVSTLEVRGSTANLEALLTIAEDVKNACQFPGEIATKTEGVPPGDAVFVITCTLAESQKA